MPDVTELLSGFDDDCPVLGYKSRIAEYPMTLNNVAGPRCISFCTEITEKAIEMIRACPPCIIICAPFEGLDSVSLPDKTLIVVDNPRLVFVQILEHFFTPKKPQGIHPSAIIDAGANIHDEAYIGPFCVIEDHCIVGEGSVLVGHVHLYAHTHIGKNVTIHSGAVIGADGFGYEKDDQGKLHKFTHLGGVVIDDDVEIGANTCIDRGTLDNTFIGRGTKIDNLVHIAHNVQIGESCVIIAHVMIAGSTKIERGSWVAPCASIREQLTLGKNTTVGLGAVVVKSVSANTTVYGNPARVRTP